MTLQNNGKVMVFQKSSESIECAHWSWRCGGGLPWWLRGKRIQLQCRRCRRHGFSPWPGKVLWKRKWQPIPVFLPRRIPWTEESGGLRFIGSQRTGYDWRNLACSMYLLWPCDSSSSHELKRNASKFPPNKNIGMFIVALFVAYSNRK